MTLIAILLGLSVFGSLYYGYFGDFFQNIQTGNLWDRDNALIPCDMCWYIRVFHYSAFVVALLALYKKEYKYSGFYISVLAILGGLVAGYKYLLEMGILQVSDTGLCNPNAAASCDSAVYIIEPFVTLSFLGLIASICVAILVHKKL